MVMTVYFAHRVRLGAELQLAEAVRLRVDASGRLAAVERGCQGPGPGDVVLPGTVVPGLVDLHVHLALDGGSDVVAGLAAVGPDELRRLVLERAQGHLRDGVTTLRDLGSPNDLVGDVIAGASGSLPHVAWAGAVTPPGGHGNFIAQQASGPAETRAAVERSAARGASWIKVFATGGVITAGSVPQALLASEAELAAAVAAARDAGLRVAAHAHGTAGILAAVRAGVDTVEHVSHVDAEVIAALGAAPATVAVSTLVATDRFVRSPAIETSTPETVTKIREHAPREAASLSRLVAASVDLAAGTDAGTTHNPHGNGVAEQALLLHDAGLDHLAVLQLLTVRNAAVLDSPAGWLATGRAADLAAYDGDPGEDLGSLARPLATVVSGTLAFSATLPDAAP